MLRADCARFLNTPTFTGLFTIKILAAFTSTNTNGTLNFILELDPRTMPCWLQKELEIWWGDTVATPGYHGRIIIGKNTIVTSTGEEMHEPIVYHGSIRFDSSPCEPGIDCPTSTYMIIPYTQNIYVQSVDEITILSLRRNSSPPCF